MEARETSNLEVAGSSPVMDFYIHHIYMKYDVCILILFFIIVLFSLLKEKLEGFSERDQNVLNALKKKNRNGDCNDECQKRISLLTSFKNLDSDPILDQDSINMFKKTSDIVQVYDAPVRAYEDEISDVVLNNPIMKLTRNTYIPENK